MILLLDTTTNPTVIGLYEFSPENSSRAKPRDYLNLLRIKIVESNPENNRKLIGIIKKFIGNSKIDVVGVVNGPGTFTGVRTGVTIANAMAYALKAPIYTIDTLTAQLSVGEPPCGLPPNSGGHMGPPLRELNNIISLLSASNTQVYFARFSKGKMIGKIELVDTMNLPNRLNDGDIIVGDLGEKHCCLITKQEFVSKNSADRIKTLLDLILEKKINPKGTPSGTIKQVLPLYIKKPNITKAKPKNKVI